MPPIIVFGQDTNDLIAVIRKACNIEFFHIKKLNNNKQAIITNNLADYKKVTHAFKQTLVQHFTYTPKQIKLQTLILRGLNNNDEPNLILEDLKRHETEDLRFEKVSPFNTKNANGSLFLVSVSHDSAIRDLIAIKFVLYRSVKWERIRRNGPTQCFRCQGYGHVAGNCNMRYRCVKCSEDHEVGKCQIKPGESRLEDLYFVQCKKSGHPASYKGCPKYKELVGRIKERSEQAREKQRPKASPVMVTKDKSYASLFQPSEPNASGHNPASGPAGPAGNQPDLGSLLAAITQLTVQMAAMQATINKQ